MSGAAGWRTARLSELCEVNPPKPKLAAVDDATEVMFVPMATLDDVSGTIAKPERSTVGAVGHKSYRSFTSGDVLFAKITPCMENGKSAVVPEIPTGLGFGSTEFHVLRPRPGVDARLIWHLVRQHSFRNEAANHFTGSVGQLRVPPDFLKDFELLVPSDSTAQERLADVLDRATTLSASTQAHLQSAGRALERFRQSVLIAACSGRLTADWRDRHPQSGAGELVEEAARLRSERLGRRFRDDLPNLDELEVELPPSWAWSSPGALCEPDRIITYGVIKLGPSVQEGVSTLRSSDVRWMRIDTAKVKRISRDMANNYKRTYLTGGEVLVTVRGTLGGVAVVPENMAGWNVSREVAVLPLLPAIDPLYCALCIGSMYGQRWLGGVAKGVAYTGVNIEDLRRFPIPLPPLVEQHEIVKRVADLLARVNRLVPAIQATADRVDRTSQAILARAFSAKLSPLADLDNAN